MNANNYVIIMAGGIGSRFWPFSRYYNPKQFQDILQTGQTLIQQTVARFDTICPKENIFIVTSKDYLGLIKEQLPFLSDDQILLEPFMRNTAPCIAYAAYKIAARNPNANLLIAPADHVIENTAEFVLCAQAALAVTAQHNILATLGIQPSRPDTGYGYIQVDEAVKLGQLNQVRMFTEKPNHELAVTFIESGEFVWNAGIFIWNARTIIAEFEKHEPAIAEAFSELNSIYYTAKEEAAIQRTYSLCKSISIDYAIMEHAENVYVLKSDFGWSDLGTWKSLFELAKKDQDQNVLHGTIMPYETSNSIIRTPKDRLVIVQGLDDFIVAEYDNVLLICKKDQEQRIKQFVADAKEKFDDQFS